MLRRAGSFGRRSSARRNPHDSDSDEPADQSAAPRQEPQYESEEQPDGQQERRGGSRRRSLSFTRRRRREGNEGGRRSNWDAVERRSSLPTPEGVAVRNDDKEAPPLPEAAGRGAEGSAAATADQQATIPVARPVLEAEPYEGLPGTLHGWLKKRHVRDKSLQKQWARRYFSVDEQRGTLSYSKSEGRRANVILPLCDVTSVRALDIDVYGPFCFVISCPPMHLTVQAEDRDQRSRWISGITHHAKLWRERSAQGAMCAATVIYADANSGPVGLERQNAGGGSHEGGRRTAGTDDDDYASYRGPHFRQQRQGKSSAQSLPPPPRAMGSAAELLPSPPPPQQYPAEVRGGSEHGQRERRRRHPRAAARDQPVDDRGAIPPYDAAARQQQPHRTAGTARHAGLSAAEDGADDADNADDTAGTVIHRRGGRAERQQRGGLLPVGSPVLSLMTCVRRLACLL